MLHRNIYQAKLFTSFNPIKTKIIIMYYFIVEAVSGLDLTKIAV